MWMIFWAEKQEEMVMELANQDLALLGKNASPSLVTQTLHGLYM